MTSAVAILERLLDSDATQKEHILETFSPHLGDLQTRMGDTFEKLIGECTAVFGPADFNCNPGADKVRQTLPSWSAGTAKNGGNLQTLRLAYWKRPDSLYYIALRTEIHPQKEKSMYYDLILGAKRRKEEIRESMNMDKLRNTKQHWISKVLPFFTGRPTGG
ncbi:MAG TPA: hypothetical protein V6C86_22770 [Oculatellaceae cyanobacterium]